MRIPTTVLVLLAALSACARGEKYGAQPATRLESDVANERPNSQRLPKANLGAPSIAPEREIRIIIFQRSGAGLIGPSPGERIKVSIAREHVGWVRLFMAGPNCPRSKNADVFQKMAKRAKELSGGRGDNQRIVIEADSTVPYAHVFWAAKSLRELGMTRIEFVMDHGLGRISPW